MVGGWAHGSDQLQPALGWVVEPILSLRLPSLGWPVGQSFRPQLGSHSLQHCFRSRIF